MYNVVWRFLDKSARTGLTGVWMPEQSIGALVSALQPVRDALIVVSDAELSGARAIWRDETIAHNGAGTFDVRDGLILIFYDGTRYASFRIPGAGYIVESYGVSGAYQGVSFSRTSENLPTAILAELDTIGQNLYAPDGGLLGLFDTAIRERIP